MTYLKDLALENARKRAAQRRVADELRDQLVQAHAFHRELAAYLGIPASTLSSYMSGAVLWPSGPANFGFTVSRAIAALETGDAA